MGGIRIAICYGDWRMRVKWRGRGRWEAMLKD